MHQSSKFKAGSITFLLPSGEQWIPSPGNDSSARSIDILIVGLVVLVLILVFVVVLVLVLLIGALQVLPP